MRFCKTATKTKTYDVRPRLRLIPVVPVLLGLALLSDPLMREGVRVDIFRKASDFGILIITD